MDEGREGSWAISSSGGDGRQDGLRRLEYILNYILKTDALDGRPSTLRPSSPRVLRRSSLHPPERGPRSPAHAAGRPRPPGDPARLLFLAYHECLRRPALSRRAGGLPGWMRVECGSRAISPSGGDGRRGSLRRLEYIFDYILKTDASMTFQRPFPLRLFAGREAVAGSLASGE